MRYGKGVAEIGRGSWRLLEVSKFRALLARDKCSELITFFRCLRTSNQIQSECKWTLVRYRSREQPTATPGRYTPHRAITAPTKLERQSRTGASSLPSKQQRPSPKS